MPKPTRFRRRGVGGGGDAAVEGEFGQKAQAEAVDGGDVGLIQQ